MFLLPAAAGLPLLCARQGTCMHRSAGFLVTMAGLIKCGGTVFFALGALDASRQASEFARVRGTAIYEVLAVLLGAGALSDLCTGLSALCVREHELEPETLRPVHSQVQFF